MIAREVGVAALLKSGSLVVSSSWYYVVGVGESLESESVKIDGNSWENSCKSEFYRMEHGGVSLCLV